MIKRKRKPPNYWTEEKITNELENIIEKLGYFPTRKKLIEIKKYGLPYAIFKYGGSNYFRKKLGYNNCYKPNGYWTEDNIIKEIKKVIDKIGHFPTRNELDKIKKFSLARALSDNGGVNYFREKMGYEIVHQEDGFWTEENIIKEYKKIIEEIGYFPSNIELIKIKRFGLMKALTKNNGPNYFRRKMGYEIIQQDFGYWTIENIINELEKIIKNIGHFPTYSELDKMKKFGLSHAINNNGGFLYFKELLGISVSAQEKYTSELMSYIGKRGKASEDIIYKILSEYCETNELPLPDLNVKLAKGNILEFVCGVGKNIGIDVTNTKASKRSAVTTISNKWRKKDYHFYLDELWVVVFTDVLSLEDYDKLNSNSPENVKVFSIEGFLKELDFSADQHMKNKINKFEACSFHNKEEMKGLNT